MTEFCSAHKCAKSEACHAECSDKHPISNGASADVASVDDDQIGGASPNALPSAIAKVLGEGDQTKLFGHLNNAIDGLEHLHGDSALGQARLRALIKAGWTANLWNLHQLCPGFYLYYCAFEGAARLLVALEEEHGQRIDLEDAVESEGMPDHIDSPRLPELVTHLYGVARAKAREIDFDFDALLRSVRSRHLHVGATLSV